MTNFSGRSRAVSICCDKLQYKRRDEKTWKFCFAFHPAAWWIEFPEQWKKSSPWADRRVRLAANLALDKQGMNDAERMGLSRLSGSMIPSGMDFALRIEPYPDDPAQARRLLAEAGYPNGFDAGDLNPLPPFGRIWM